MPIPGLYIAPKSIAFSADWSEVEDSDGYVLYRVPLAVDGIIESSVILHFGTYKLIPDQHVTAELQCRTPDGQRLIRIERIDWRDLRGGHNNKRDRCSGPFGGRRVPATHVHSFALNWVGQERRMKRGKLPCAEPLLPEPQSFEELRQIVGTRFNINNIDVVPRPPWRYDLFR